jgi:hypothetical protein
VIFTEVEKPTVPAFDFDLTLAVLQQIPSSDEIVEENRFTTISIGGAALLGIGMLIFYFAKQPTNLFEGLSSITLGILLTPTLAILLFLGYDMYTKYQKQMERLNFS